MLREDLSGRFDYLFEPLEVGESAGNGDDAALHGPEQAQDDGRWSRRIVLFGVVAATLAAAAATAIVLLQPARPAQVIMIPTDSTPLSTSASAARATTTAAHVPVAPATSTTPAPQRSAARPTLAPQPPPVQAPTTIAGQPAQPAAPTSATRAPISVSPESRTPFPDQNPNHRSNGPGGGLLGGLL